MYIGIFIVLLVMTFVLGKRIYKSTLNPIFIWGTLWSLVGILSNAAFYDYYKPSDFVNTTIIVGILVYTFFCFFYGATKRSIVARQINIENFKINFEYNVFLIINIISILLQIPFFLKAIRIYISHGFNMAYLRGILTDASEGVVSGGIISILLDSGVKNVFTLSAIYAAILLVSKKEYPHKKKIIGIAIFEMILISLTNAARVFLVNFIIYIVIAVLFFHGTKIISVVRNNKKMIIIVVSLLGFGLILQNSRASDMSILKTIYIYYCSGPGYLTQLLSDGNSVIQVNSDYYMGTVTLGFLSNIYYYLKIALTGINDSTVKLIASVITIKQYRLGPTTYINAMCTCFYPFLVDWGNAGIVIGPIIAGFLTCRSYKEMKKYMDIRGMASCMFVFWVMYNTVFKWSFIYIDFTVILLINYFICPRRHQRFVLLPLNRRNTDE